MKLLGRLEPQETDGSDSIPSAVSELYDVDSGGVVYCSRADWTSVSNKLWTYVKEKLKNNNHLVVKQAELHGLLKQQISGNIKPFHINDWNLYKKDIYGNPFSFYESTCCILAELATIECGTKCPYKSLKGLGMLSICQAMKIMNITTKLPDQACHETESVGSGLYFLFNLKSQFKISSIIVLLTGSIISICSNYIATPSTPIITCPTLIALNLFVWSVSLPALLSYLQPPALGHFAKSFSSNPPIGSADQISLSYCLLRPILKISEESVEFGLHPSIQNIVGLSSGWMRLIDETTKHFHHMTIVIMVAVSVFFACITQHDNFLKIFLQSFCPTLIMGLARDVLLSLIPLHSLKGALVIQQIKLVIAMCGFRCLQILLFFVILNISNSVSQQLVKRYNIFSPKVVLLQIIPYLIFGVVWNSSLSTELQSCFQSSRESLWDTHNITEIFPASTIQYLPLLSAQRITDDMHVILERSGVLFRYMIETIRFLVTELNPFESVILLQSVYNLIFKRVTYAYAFLNSFDSPFMVIVLSTLSLWNPNLCGVFIFQISYELMNSKEELIKQEIPIDLYCMGHQGLTTTTKNIVITKFDSSSRLNQFIISFRLTLLICQFLILYKFFNGFSIVSACLFFVLVLHLFDSIDVFPHWEGSLQTDASQIFRGRKSTFHYEPPINVERLEKAASLIVDHPDSSLPDLLSQMEEKEKVDLSFLNRFLGTWKLIKERSDPMEAVSKAMGVSWAIRKAIEQFTPTVRYTRNNNLVLNVAQMLPMNMSKNILLRLDGKEYSDQDADIGQWKSRTIIENATLISTRQRVSDGLYLTETRQILTEGMLNRCIPDMTKDVLWYLVELKRSENGPVEAYSNRRYKRIDDPPKGVPLPWDNLTTENSGPIPLISSLDDLPSLALSSHERCKRVSPKSNQSIRSGTPRICSRSDLVKRVRDSKVDQSSARLIQSYGSIGLSKHPPAGTLGNGPIETSKSFPVSRKVFKIQPKIFSSKFNEDNLEDGIEVCRSDDWNNQEIHQTCILSIKSLQSLKISQSVLQEMNRLAHLTAIQVYHLSDLSMDPANIDLSFGNEIVPTSKWIVLEDKIVKIDRMSIDNQPSIARATVFINTSLTLSQVAQELFDPAFFNNLDTTVDRSLTMYRITPDLLMGYQSIRGAFGVAGRDFVFISERLTGASGDWISISAKSISVPEIDSQYTERFTKDFVRGDIIRAGICIQRKDHGIVMTYVNQVNAEIPGMPNWLVDYFKLGNLRRVAVAKNYFESKKSTL